MTGTILGCIADDFTGATDLAGVLARSGVQVSLRIGVPDTPPQEAGPFEVIALKSRTAEVPNAVAESRAALDWLQKAGAERVFFKYCSTFDSTSHGNIGPVAEALMHDLGADQTIYCPAFPENGRFVFMGNLFVGQLPLSESSMKDHPLTPMRDSNLMRLLAPQVRGDVGLIDRQTIAQGPNAVQAALASLKESEVRHVIVDAVSNADLETIARVCQDMPLITGGSAVAMPLPALYHAKGLRGASVSSGTGPKTEAKAIILSGSCSAMTNAQVAAYLATGAPRFQLDPVQLAKSGPRDVLDWLAGQDLTHAPLIYATAEPESVKRAQSELGIQEAGALIERTLAHCAGAALKAGAGRLIVAGGETSGAVTQALGVTQLDIGAEIVPGVPWTYSSYAGRPIALALKSGNFGAESFFIDAIAKLGRSEALRST